MVEYLRGRVVATGTAWIVFEAGGFGLRVRVHDAPRFRKLVGREVRLPAWFEVSPRKFELYGFLDAAERDRFAALLGIPGIGPATALRLLPAWDALARPGASVPAIPGVGPVKVARIAKWLARRGGAQVAETATAAAEAAKALRALGMTATEARTRAAAAAARSPGATVEALIRLATARGSR